MHEIVGLHHRRCRPAGLTAALYMARYRRKALVVHDGRARALRIPKTHNAPGFPDGIAGAELVDRMIAHACEFGALIEEAEIVAATRGSDHFELTSTDGQNWQSRSLILATGICLNQIDMPHDEHEAASEAGTLRYCPVCDGYEHIDSKICVVGCDRQGAAEALFLRRYSADVTLIPNNFPDLYPDELAAMRDAGISVIEHPLDRLHGHADRMDVYLQGENEPLSFGVVYPALGCNPRNELARLWGFQSAMPARSRAMRLMKPRSKDFMPPATLSKA